MTYEDILYERRGAAVWLTLNRPEVLNAVRQKTFEEIRDATGRIAAERGVAAVVLTGAGERAFCAGGDVAEMRDLDPRRGRVFLETFIAAIQALRALPVPVIARIRGYCIAGGNELNMACDLAVASEDAQLGQAGPKVGSVPVITGTQMMPRLTGERFAKEVVFLCKRYGAREALARGWVNEVVPADKLDAAVQAVVDRLAGMSPTAIRIAKASLNMEADMLLGPSLRTAVEALAPLYGSAELREGMSAFLEKRPPSFEQFR
ncbi:MAG TPA: enoyl-CoA hydratase-related protein [Myxococcales bacterium]|nr:enoyl-CoA hydratase-related protein [Myxococcales bacterium]